MKLSEELLPGCVICKRQWKRKDVDQYVYHDSKGVVCKSHPGVLEWFNELVEKAGKELQEMGITWVEEE